MKPFINFGNDLPGILASLTYDKEAGKALNNLAEVLLRRESTLTIAEREFLASATSAANKTEFCRLSHAQFSKAANKGEFIEPSDKLIALEEIVRYVAESEMGSAMNPHLIENARDFRASDNEIHEAILIASAFCMYNRIVMFTNSPLPPSKSFYEETAKRINEHGYLKSEVMLESATM